jgi:predicted nucleotidyltransferase
MHDADLAQLVAEASDAYAPSQAELAAEIGVRPLALTTWRNGRSRPTAGHLKGMAEALERRSEQLRGLAAQLDARAAVQGKLTRRSRRARSDESTAQLLASRIVAAAGGRVLRIVFYGSRARGEPRSASSDWDFIVVLSGAASGVEGEQSRLERAAAGPEGSYRVDVWPMDLESWETARHLRGHPVRSAEQEGRVLYDIGSSHPGLGGTMDPAC